jgi:ubiquinone/menaquinone biosynthesis C-methylase UbiE
MDTNPTLSVPASENGGFMNPEVIVGSLGVVEGMRVADFGCGSGFFAITLGKLVGDNGHVVAIDVMEAPLEAVKAKATIEGLNNLETIRGNLEVIGGSKLSNESQDLVLIKNVLFQSTQKQEIIKEAARSLKPGGKLVIIDWKKDAAGLGPPNDLRIDTQAIRQIISQSGFGFLNEIKTDAFHFGMIFSKI